MNDGTGGPHAASSIVSKPGEKQAEQLHYLFLPFEIFAYVARQEKAGYLDVHEKDIMKEIGKKFTNIPNMTIEQTLTTLVVQDFLNVIGIEGEEGRAYGIDSNAKWMKDLIDDPEGIKKLVNMYNELTSKK